MTNLAELYGIKTSLNQKNDKQVIHLKNETGTGKVSIYHVFSGVRVAYNDMYMEYCKTEQNTSDDFIEINHCMEGRYECRLGKENCYYMSPGDLAISCMKGTQTESCFPTCHYHGMSVFIEPSLFTEQVREVFKILAIKMDRVIQLSQCKNQIALIRSNNSIAHIFTELYGLKGEVRDGYLKIKVLELLLFLGNVSVDTIEPDYLGQKQVNRAKQMKEYMIADLQSNLTIKKLAEHFGLSPSTVKQEFKNVYGTSIHKYVKEYRLQTAQKKLCETDQSITCIAHEVGYENPGKFSAAFKNEFGVSPMEYRKTVHLDR